MRKTAALLAATIGLTLLTGCSMLEEGADAAEEPAVSARTAFSIEVATICQEHLVPIFDIPERPTPEQEAQYLAFARQSTDEAADAIEELEAPPGDEERVTSLLADLRAYAALSDHIIPAVRAGTTDAVMAQLDPEVTRLEERLDDAFAYFDVESCEV